MYFLKDRLPKTWLDEWLKSRVSEYPKTDNKENASKHCSNLNDTTFTILLFTVKRVALEEVSFSATQNPKILS